MKVVIELDDLTVKMLSTMGRARGQSLEAWIQTVLNMSARQMARIIGTQDSASIGKTLDGLRSIDGMSEFEKGLEKRKEEL